MVVGLILKAGKALRVGAGQAFQHDRAAIRHDESGPDQQDAVLPERDLAIVSADELRALWNKEISSGRAVIDVLGHLGRDRQPETRRRRGPRHTAWWYLG